MIRAGVFIGVNNTGNLRELRDAAQGARRMHEWALKQGMEDNTHAKLITDEGGKEVTSRQIFKAIREIIEGPGADQLILYFAGHGVNINRSEHWLLTDAPLDTSAAIDVRSSVELARYCGIGYVAVISDACRLAPEGIQAQNMRGTDAFPNESASDKATPVDQFYACLLGRAAAELKDPAAAAEGYRALYTEVLLHALAGNVNDILEPSDSESGYLVKPVKLESYLEKRVPARVRELGLETKVNQNPDAIITAHSHWISRVNKRPRVLRTATTPLNFTPPNLKSITNHLVQAATASGPKQLIEELSRLKSIEIPDTASLISTVEQVATPFGPDRFESQCGIKVRGARIIEFSMREASGQLLTGSGELLRIDQINEPISVVLRFEGNFGAVIPALPGYLASLTFDKGELLDVSFEPSANSHFWTEYANRANEIRALRGVAASASRQGRFRLDHVEDPFSIARKMQIAKGIDPTLAVYAAYAYNDLQEISQIRKMDGYLRNNLSGATLFDVALLGRMLLDKPIGRNADVVPFVPLFSQGWPLLRAHRVHLDSSLVGIDHNMRESVWSLFDGEGVDRLRDVLLFGRVR
jgi:hypothetical protein